MASENYSVPTFITFPSVTHDPNFGETDPQGIHCHGVPFRRHITRRVSVVPL